MSWNILRNAKTDKIKYFFKCLIFFHNDEFTYADECEPAQLGVAGVYKCKQCNREYWI